MDKPDILSRIVSRKKEEVDRAGKQIPENRLREEAEAIQERRPFIQALAQPGSFGVNVIAEVKRASPSKGDISLNLNPGSLAKKYEQGGAAALSVLTDQHYFKGSFEDLKKARAATDLRFCEKIF
jgi:indole-3-glycerol phosphate synthase